MLLRALLLGTTAIGSLQAQQPGRVISGVVFDSLGSKPLRGAVVQAVFVDTPAERVYSAVSDTAGHYRIAGVPSGRFAIGFQHRALHVLGIDTPIRAMDAHADSQTVDLAIPGGTAVRTLACGTGMRLEGEGMLVGYIVDAHGESAAKGAVVHARWIELDLEKKNYHAVTRTVTALTDEDGRYRICGLTSDDAITVEVATPGYFNITHKVTIPRDGAARQDFHLARSSSSRGGSSLTGNVRFTDGSALAFGRATIPALALETPIRNGEFNFSGLPAGTWEVETSAVGFEQQTALVDVADGTVTSQHVLMGEKAQMLDAVTVLGKPGGEAKLLRAIEARRRTANGTVFLPGNDWLAIARDPADLVREAAGFRYINENEISTSGCGFRPSNGEATTMVTRTLHQRERTVAVYLDGLRVVGGIPELRTAVTMRDVLAVEAYQDIATAPPAWRTYDACAVIAIWTKR